MTNSELLDSISSFFSIPGDHHSKMDDYARKLSMINLSRRIHEVDTSLSWIQERTQEIFNRPDLEDVKKNLLRKEVNKTSAKTKELRRLSGLNKSTKGEWVPQTLPDCRIDCDIF